MTMIMQVLLFLMASSAANAEIYKLSNMLSENPVVESFDKSSGRQLDSRRLQLDIGTLGSINATTDTCSVVGAGIRCDVNSLVTAEDGSNAGLRIQVNCPLDSQIAFDFRRAHGCACGAEVTSFPSGIKKFCPCIVCPMNFGISPISIDCSMKNDPFVISTCTFLDCGFACNGTCEFNCRNSGPGCDFCKPKGPTPAPSAGGGNLPPSIIGATSSASHMSLVWTLPLVLVSSMYVLWK